MRGVRRGVRRGATVLAVAAAVAVVEAGCQRLVVEEPPPGGGMGSSTTYQPPPGFSSTSTSTGDPGPTTGTTSTTGAASDGGATFPLEPDMGPWTCPYGPCGWDPEVDCPSGTKCVPCMCKQHPADLARPHEVCAASGTIPVGDPCPMGVAACGADLVDPCEEGSVCVFGVCYPVCRGLPDVPTCDDPNAQCLLLGDAWARSYGCTIPCDPLAGACKDGTQCAMIDAAVDPGFVFSCVLSVGDGGYGAPCEDDGDCADGLMCVGDLVLPPGACDGGGCCTPFCDMTDPLGDAQCPDVDQGMKCSYFVDDPQAPGGYGPLPGAEHVGLCFVPP